MWPLRMLGLFILMLLQADADSDCPLTLHPPELVVQYGDTVEVNCTSEDSDQLGIEWSDKNGSYVSEMEGFAVWTVNVSDWDAEARCQIQNESQCSKDLKLTVYQNPEYITVFPIPINGSLQGEEGKEYQLQCDIVQVAPVQNLTVRWYRGKSIVKNETNSSNMSKTPVNVSFNLTHTLSRDDDGMEFTCVAELDLGPEIPQTPVNHSVSVRVHYKPGVVCPPRFVDVEGNFSLSAVPCRVEGNPPADVKWYHKEKVIDASSTMTRNDSGEYVIVATNRLGNATVTIFLSVEYPPKFEDVSSAVDVTMGSNVSLDCTAKGNPPPQIQWFHDAEGSSVLNISGINSSATYNCTAANKHGTISKQIYVNVIMTPSMPTPKEMASPATEEMTTPAPDIHPLVLKPARVVVRYGDSVSVNCSTSSPDHNGMGWESEVGGTEMMEKVTYVTWTLDNLTNWAIEPSCYINIGEEQHEKKLPVTLYKTPDAVRISQVNHTGPMYEGKEYQLQCKIIKVAPLQNLTVKWYHQNNSIPGPVPEFDAADALPKDEIHSIRIIPSRTDHGAKYRCEAQLDLGPDGPQPPPTKTSSPLTVLVFSKPVIQGCPSHFSGVEHSFTLSTLPCRADGFPPATVHWYHEGRQIDASTPLTRMQSGTFITKAHNFRGQTNMSIDITIEYGPTFDCEGRYEVKENDENSLLCKPDGKPEPRVSWFKDGQEVHKPSTRRDSGNYTLRATNEHGTTNHTLYVDILYKPVIQGDCPSNFRGAEHSFTLSTLPCRADGFPPATVHWYHGESRINASTPLTRMQSGTFILVAQNNMGQTNMSIDITVEYGPTFACEGRYDVKENDENSLLCKPDGKPEPQLTWFKDGQQVQKPSTRRDSGNYTLRATNEHGTTNHTLYVDILYKPVIQDCPSHYSGVTGVREFTLNKMPCRADGNPPATLRWYHGGKLIDASAPLTRMQSGAFILEANNTMGRTNMSIDITIEYIHPLVLKPARVVVRYGDSVSVNCSTSSPDHDGMGWESEVGGTEMMEKVTYVTWTVDNLTDWKIKPSCYINTDTQHEKELTVTLYKTPDAVKISQVNQTRPMYEGTEYQLQCNIIQVAPLQNLTVKWYRQNNSIPVPEHAFDGADALPKDANHSIRIIPSRTDHGAQYRCEAQLDLGPDGPQPPPTKTSSPLTVSVRYKPVIEGFTQGSETEFEPGTDLNLTCIAEGNPPPTVQWIKSAGNVDLTATGGRQSSTYRITGATSTHAGDYICFATNELGNVYRTITLKMMKDESTTAANHWLWIIPLIILTIIIICLVFYYNRRNRGHYRLDQGGPSASTIPLQPLLPNGSNSMV